MTSEAQWPRKSWIETCRSPQSVLEEIKLGSYRSRLDILADMLQVLKEDGSKKTHIMYQANLSYKLLTKYLDEALEARLIRFHPENELYKLTTKGKFFLEEYEKYNSHSSLLEKQIDDLNDRKKGLEELSSNR